MTNIGLILSIIGSLALIISNMPILLLTGRVLRIVSSLFIAFYNCFN